MLASDKIIFYRDSIHLYQNNQSTFIELLKINTLTLFFYLNTVFVYFFFDDQGSIGYFCNVE